LWLPSAGTAFVRDWNLVLGDPVQRRKVTC
jgi:hypothetical protein